MTALTVGKAFFDTNIFLYAHSTANLLKQAVALELVQKYSEQSKLVLSTQVVQEFYSAGLRKLGLSRALVKQSVVALMGFQLILLGPPHIMKAIENEERYRISFWDALILAAAESAGAEVLFTEDLNDGQQYGEVLVRNPFREPQELGTK
jgi:predicted nucleic acid-binding protein